MLGYIYRQQLGQLLSAKRILVTLFGALAIGGLCLVYLNARGSNPLAHTYVRLSEAIIFRVAALVCALYTMNVISAEIQQKTIVYLVTVPVKRSVMFLGRVLAAATAAALASVVFVVIAALLVFKGQILGGDIGALVLRDCIAVALGAFSYCGIYVVLSLLLNHALLYSLLFAFGWETLVPNMPGDLYKGSILRHIISAGQHPELPRNPNGVTGTLQRVMDTNFTINPTTSLIVLTLIPIVTFAFGAFWFERNEYVPREDYE